MIQVMIPLIVEQVNFQLVMVWAGVVVITVMTILVQSFTGVEAAVAAGEHLAVTAQLDKTRLVNTIVVVQH